MLISAVQWSHRLEWKPTFFISNNSRFIVDIRARGAFVPSWLYPMVTDALYYFTFSPRLGVYETIMTGRMGLFVSLRSFHGCHHVGWNNNNKKKPPKLLCHRPLTRVFFPTPLYGCIVAIQNTPTPWVNLIFLGFTITKQFHILSSSNNVIFWSLGSFDVQTKQQTIKVTFYLFSGWVRKEKKISVTLFVC